MSVITLHGSVTKKGSGEYGEWAVISEPNVKRDGDTYEKRYMTSAAKTASVPAIGTEVVVTGFAQADVREYEGKHYADIKVSGAHYFALSGAASAADPAEDFAEEIPF